MKRVLILLLVLFGAVNVRDARAFMPLNTTAMAYFSNDCLQCLHQGFRKLGGVGTIDHGFVNVPGRVPTLRVQYDPRVVSYGALLQNFWDSVHAAGDKATFCSEGKNYVAGIFIVTSPQKELASRLLPRQSRGKDTLIRSVPIFYLNAQPEFAKADKACNKR